MPATKTCDVGAWIVLLYCVLFKFKMMLSVGQIITLHELTQIHVDKSFKTINGRVEYDAIDYPNNASGWWVKVSRLTDKGIKVRSMHTDTKVIVTEIRTQSGKTVDFFDKEVRRKDALGLL